MSTEHRESDLIRSWLDESYEAEGDPHDYLEHLLDKVPDTPQQRRRWWPFPLFRREAQAPTATATDTTEYQPNPIPASNGHTPTVIGRTTSMLSPVKAITAGALVLAIGGAFLIAQPFDQQGGVPGAEVDEATTEPSPPAIVAGNMLNWGEVVQEGTETMVDGVDQRRGLLRDGARFEMDDSRLTGTVSYVSNGDGRSVGDTTAALFSLAWHIENEEGSWSGSCPMLQIMEPMADPSMMEPIIFYCSYTGAGAYEGLSAYLMQQFTAELPSPIKGLIFEGDLPPMPELPSAE